MIALMVQALLPAAAMAAMADSPQRIAICTAAGLKTVEVGGDPASGKAGFAGMACLDCVFTAMAAVPAPPPASLPVRYAAQVAVRSVAAVSLGLGARPPPRPPSRAPPAALNA